MDSSIKTLVSDNLGLTADNLGAYFNNLFDLALLIGAILAVLIIASAGIQYMTSDAIPAKTDSKTRITQALIGLLMLLGVWLFFNEINPNILNLDFELEAVQTTGAQIQGQTAEQRRQADAAARAARNPILPGSRIGTEMLTPTWTQVPFNQYCRNVRGDGWVNIDPHHCTGASPSRNHSCCGKDPNYKPPAEVKRYERTGQDLGQFYGSEQPPAGSWCYKFSSDGSQCFTVEGDCEDERLSDDSATTRCQRQ